jgi:ribose transport system substrate-binding protein
MKYILLLAMIVCVVFAWRALPAKAAELPPEVAERFSEKAKLEAGLPTGPSVYRNWKSPKFQPWSFAYVGSTRYGTWSDAALKYAREQVQPQWERRGLASRLVVPNTAADDGEASRQIRALADQGIDAILVCCGSPQGLDDAIRYAHQKGSLVVTLLNFSASPYALNTTPDYVLIGGNFVDRMADELDSKGNVLVVGGFLDATASEAFDRGVRQGFQTYPKLKMIGDIAVQGGADAARAAVRSWLNTHHDPVDGLILRSGAEAGVVQEFAAASRKFPMVTIGGDRAALCFWRHNLDFNGQDFLQKAIVDWPPGDAIALAYDVAQRTLQGQGPKTQTILVDSLLLSLDDLKAAVPADCREDDAGWLSVGGESWGGGHELDAYFAKPADPLAYKP